MTATTTTSSMPTLKAVPRTAAGKSAARRLRDTGLVPAIAYGPGMPATCLAVTPKEVANILRSERGQNSVVQLDMEGGMILAMVRDFTVHPVDRSLEHIDFVQVKLDQPVDVSVPLFPQGKPVGVTKGGVLRLVYRTVPVRCLPDRIPLRLEADVTHLELGEHIAAQELKLPEGVSVRLPPEQTLISIVAPEKEEVVEAVPGAAAAAVPGAAPAAGAPAAGAAPADAGKDDKKKK